MKIRLRILAITTLAVLATVTALTLGSFTAQAQSQGAVPNLQLSSTSPGELTITWDSPNPVPTDYRLRWAEESLDFLSYSAPNEANRGSEYPEPQDTSMTLTDLSKGSTFKIQIRTRYETGGDNNGPWSGPWTDEFTQRVNDDPPAAPTGLSTSQVTHDNVTLSWTAPSRGTITGYSVLRGADANSMTALVADTGSTSTQYTDSSVAAETAYVYAIQALSPDGNGAQSGTTNVTTTAPPSPTVAPTPVPASDEVNNLTLASDTVGQLDIAWSHPTDEPNDYRIMWAPADEDYLSYSAENTDQSGNSYPAGDVTTFTLTGLAGGSTYKVMMRARYHNAETNEYSSGPWTSDVTQRVRNNLPAAPTELTLTETTSKDQTTSINLAWTAPSHDDLTGYQIWRGVTADSLTELVQDTAGVATTYSDATTETDNTYVYAVTALSLDGDSPRSTTMSITRAAAGTTTRDDPENTARSSHDLVTGVIGVGGENRISISWDRNDASFGYYIQWSKLDANGNTNYLVPLVDGNTPTSGQYRALTTSTTSHTTPTNLEAGKWKVRVQAQSGSLGGNPTFGPFTESTEIRVTNAPVILASSYTGDLVHNANNSTFTKMRTHFTTGDNELGYRLTKVTHSIRFTSINATAHIGATVNEDNGGVLGTQLYAFPDETFLVTNVNTQTMTHTGEFILKPNKKYWVVISKKAGTTTTTQLALARTNDVPTAQPGWTLATSSDYLFNEDWRDLGEGVQIRLEGVVRTPVTDEPDDQDFPMDASTRGRLRLGKTTTGTLDNVDDNVNAPEHTKRVPRGDLIKIEGLTAGNSYRVRAWFGTSKEDSATAARGGAIGLQAGQKGSDDIASFSPHNDNLLDDGRASFVFPAFAKDYYVDLVAPAFRPPNGALPAHIYFGPYMLEIYDLGVTQSQSEPHGYGIKASNICINNRCYNDPRFPGLDHDGYANTETIEVSVGNDPTSKNLLRSASFTVPTNTGKASYKLDRIGAFVHDMNGSSIPQAAIYSDIVNPGTELFVLEPLRNDDRHIDYFVAPQDAQALLPGISYAIVFSESGGENASYKLYATADFDEDTIRHPSWTVGNLAKTKDNDVSDPAWTNMREGDTTSGNRITPQIIIYTGLTP